MTGDDEAWSELMTYRPVRVRSWPIFRFPVGIRRYVSVGHPTGHSNRPVEMAGMNPVCGSEPAYVPFDSS